MKSLTLTTHLHDITAEVLYKWWLKSDCRDALFAWTCVCDSKGHFASIYIVLNVEK